MRTITKVKYSLFRWIFSNVLKNTIFTIVLTIVGTFIITNYFTRIVSFLIQNWTFIVAVVIILLFAYLAFSYEKTLRKIRFKDGSLDSWENNEFRRPAVATIMENALFLQFMDIPFTLNYELPFNYALEFKAKVLVSCFAWCIGANMDRQDMHCYMFQYSESDRKLNPHMLVSFDSTAGVTRWVLPGTGPLRSRSRLELESKEGWYFLRTEVRTRENQANVSNPQLPDEYKIRDESGQEITYDTANIDTAIEIKVFNMYDLGKLIYHIVFTEPPLKCYKKGDIGFRNYGFESALYKDIRILRI